MIEKVWEELSIHDKAYMLKRDWKVKEESVCSSTEISNRSIRLAERNREGITDDIYERKVNVHKYGDE